MPDIKFPVIECSQDKFLVVVDLDLYEKDAIVSTLYKFSHLFYIHQLLDLEVPNRIKVYFESRQGNSITEDIPKKFCNELIDQQLRCNINKKFGHIRDMIVQEAFRPVNTK